VEEIKFLVLKIRTNYKKLGLEGKSVERVHTWANSTGYTSLGEKAESKNRKVS
jgi:hypothetical protein